jgi:hypothetical protein
MTLDIQHLMARFEFIRNNLSIHINRPFKVTFDAKPYPYLIVIE